MDKSRCTIGENETPYTIERVAKSGQRVVIWRGKTYDAGVDRLKSIESNMRHELWTEAWIHTDFGYMPMASIN